jgi:hypothetical protein
MSVEHCGMVVELSRREAGRRAGVLVGEDDWEKTSGAGGLGNVGEEEDGTTGPVYSGRSLYARRWREDKSQLDSEICVLGQSCSLPTILRTLTCSPSLCLHGAGVRRPRLAHVGRSEHHLVSELLPLGFLFLSDPSRHVLYRQLHKIDGAILS